VKTNKNANKIEKRNINAMSVKARLKCR